MRFPCLARQVKAARREGSFMDNMNIAPKAGICNTEAVTYRGCNILASMEAPVTGEGAPREFLRILMLFLR